MGYTIIIGELVLDDSDPEDIHYTVEVTEDVSAPIFPGDEATHNTNVRKPKYSAWIEFLHTVGLYDLFMDESTGLMRQHPGIAELTEDHYRQINEVYLLMTAFNDRLPGWSASEAWNTRRYGNKPSTTSLNEFDPELARLAWLRFWTRWALDNCSSPAIYNG